MIGSVAKVIAISVAPTLFAAGERAALSGEATGISSSIPVWSDEFVGPFPSWSNVRTQYGAMGDGVHDDTAALQRALTDLATQGHPPVLFIPNGTYRITDTLTLAFAINLSVVGEDPASTTLVWDGPEGGTMLDVNGVAYSRIVRLTFDGARRASVAVEQSWDASRSHFDTGNEYADNAFVDVEYGIRGGFRGHGFAETSILRSRFVRNTEAGVALGNFNALDIWIWYSTFEDCNVGVTNGTGAGNYRVYNSVFRNSTTADLFMGNTGGFSARGNYSIGSRAFFVSAGYTGNPATIHLQRNTIVDPADRAAIRLGNQGPGLIVDNIIRSRPEAIGPVVEWSSFPGADVVSVGNTFTVAEPVASNGRLLSVDDEIVAAETLAPVEPELPETLPNRRRRVFGVPRGGDGREIQAAIDAASSLSGMRPVVHVPYGIYQISETLVVPSSDVQIVGDGYGTILRWNGSGAGPIMRLQGPTRAALRELAIDGAGRADGLIVEDVDQVGARVYLQQVQLRHSRQSDLIIDGLDHAHVQLEDVGHAYSPGGAAVLVRGGPLRSSGSPADGRVSVFSGASAGNRISYDLSGGARVLVRDLWYESGAGPGFARIHGRAEVTVDGLRVSSPANQPVAAFEIVDLDGTAAVLATHIDDRIAVSGDGSNARVLVAALFCEQRAADCVVRSGSPPAVVGVVAFRQISRIPGIRSVAAPDEGGGEAAFVKGMLGHAREEHPEVIRSLPAGLTDVRLFRVWVSHGVRNLVLRP